MKKSIAASLLLAASAAAATNIAYTVHAAPPQVYTSGHRLVFNVSWDTAPGARGFAHLRLLSQNPESAASPALSMLLHADGSFEMVRADRAPILNPSSLVAGNTAPSHAAAIQVYPSPTHTRFAGDYAAAWPHTLDANAISGSVEILLCGEGISLATPVARWQPTPTLFLLK